MESDQGKEIRNYPIAELEKPLSKVFQELKPQLDKDAYGLVVFDDTSGRIPGFVVSRTIDLYNIYRGKKRIPRFGISALPTEFGAETTAQEFEEKSKKRLFDSSKRVLLVTEWISEGGHMKDFQTLFSNHNLSFDIAAVQIKMPEEAYRNGRVILPSTKLFYGEVASAPPRIFHNRRLTGLERAEFFKTKPVLHGDQSLVISARRDAIRLSDRLFEQMK